jgi:uncharacterized membrane protein
MFLKRILRHLFYLPWLSRRHFPLAVMERIEQTIAASEQHHAGEVRFAVEATLDARRLFAGMSARTRALEVFSELRVWDTEANSGVLIYLLLADRDVEIVADRGVALRVDQERWEAICRAMEARLRAGEYEQAVVDAIERVSALLAEHFPPHEADANELPDQPVRL